MFGFQQFSFKEGSIYKVLKHAKHGVVREAGKITLAYIIVYYIINIAFVQFNVVCDDKMPLNNTDHTLVGELFDRQPFGLFVKSYKTKEKRISSMVTWFLGFYVSFMMARWWQQVTSIPTLDELCYTFHGALGVDRKDSEKVLTELEAEHKVLRYCLLAWTMCLSGLSPPMRQTFYNGSIYIEKGLLTEKELRKLKPSAQGTVDGWAAKWFIPL